MIRLSTYSDLDNIQKVYAAARAYMKSTNNYNQWKDSKPTLEDIKKDIDNNCHYSMEEDGNIIACFTIIDGVDKTYNYIDGKWLNEDKYIAIHKVASLGVRHGILKDVLKFVSEINSNIKIDTHKDNKTMQHLLLKNGFKECGIIYLENGEDRIAYQRV